MKVKPVIQIKDDWCKSCGICVAFCPRNVLKMGTFYVEIANPEACTGCKMCENLCPDFAITIVIPSEIPANSDKEQK